MKKLLLPTLIVLGFFSCKKSEPVKVLSTTEKIAMAYGFADWNQVRELQFTFNVDRDTLHFERSWTWKPKTNEVTMITASDTISYNRAAVDSISLKADKAFINDTYWLLAPYKLVWDEGFEIDTIMKDLAPISKDSLQKLSIVYSGPGGYTPGDGYDFYFDDEHIIREWVYREKNENSVCMTTTWEDHQSYNGLKLATMHQNENGSFKLYFNGISVLKDSLPQ